MIRRPPRSTLSSSSAASDVYKRQLPAGLGGRLPLSQRADTPQPPGGSQSVPPAAEPGRPWPAGRSAQVRTDALTQFTGLAPVELRGGRRAGEQRQDGGGVAPSPA